MPTFVNISCFLRGGGCFFLRTAGAVSHRECRRRLRSVALEAKSAKEEEEKSDRTLN